ncbi:unnamed protein product, partial [Meganyctiphanes norvegica]
ETEKNYDFLSIGEEFGLLDFLSGNLTNLSYKSCSNQVQLEFLSDPYVNLKGFRLNWFQEDFSSLENSCNFSMNSTSVMNSTFDYDLNFTISTTYAPTTNVNELQCFTSLN